VVLEEGECNVNWDICGMILRGVEEVYKIILSKGQNVQQKFHMECPGLGTGSSY
jgi:hypothetical protein